MPVWWAIFDQVDRVVIQGLEDGIKHLLDVAKVDSPPHDFIDWRRQVQAQSECVAMNGLLSHALGGVVQAYGTVHRELFPYPVVRTIKIGTTTSRLEHRHP